MSYVKIWVHCVWSTKMRKPFLESGIKNKVIEHIRENAKIKNIYIDFINGYSEHLHALISLQKKQNISDVMQLIKGESSWWINKSNLLRNKFSWQDDFFAVSVSHSQVNEVRDYIKNQEQHHKKMTWDEEIELFKKNMVLKE